MTLDKALSWFVVGWLWVVVILTLMSFTGTVISAPSIWTGLLRVRDELNPFNFRYYFTMILLLSPALLAMWWRDKRQQKRPGKSN